MTNPLLTPFSLPPFSAIKPEHVVPAVTKALEDCRAAVESAVAHGAPYSWENLCQPLAEVDDVLGRIFSPVSHLNSVKNSPELREAYEQTLPLLSEYSTWVGQHEGLYKAYRDLRDGDNYATLNTAQKKAVDNALRDFELSGIGLPPEAQKRYGEIAARLSELGNQYSNNVLDATMGWNKLVTDVADLAGMPESALAAAQAQAQAKEQEGYLLTLDIPSYLPVMTYCDNQALRERMYRAYSTRASDQGPNAGKWDNSPVMAEILALRHELAQLLGFDSYAYKSLATKMAKDPQQVLDFLTDLAKRARPQGEKSWPSCAPSPKPSLASMSCSRGTLPTTAKNRSSTSTASVMSSCAPISRKTKPLAACLKWLSAFTVLPLKSVPMSMCGIRKCASSSCMTNTTSCAAASISTCMPANISAGGRGWTTASARCVNWMVPCRSRSPT